MTTTKRNESQGIPLPPLGRWLNKSGNSAEELRERMLSGQIIARGIDATRTIEAMCSVPRHAFLPEHSLKAAYRDRPQRIGHGQTISQPYIIALMTSQLEELPRDSRILEIGSGCGYQTAILVQMGFEVHALEIVPELVEHSSEVLRELNLSPASLACADGRAGLPSIAPFSAVLSAACPIEAPITWIDQLSLGGILVAPIGTRSDQHLVRMEKDADDVILTKTLCPVRFVPLV
ncbi:MAG: protein-L-isoaspartate O-methyltransferase [Candidatus Thalassarchaeaceae archaeon]|nr:protein-L-isoaspartate O-methyltransferase [Candidatus Thalassarchaeaceae archaeon]